MRAINGNDRVKFLQIIVCAVLGMATAAFVGRQGAVTVACTALLVIYTDRGYAGSVAYIIGRIKLQIFMGATVLLTFLLLRTLLPGSLWLAEMLTLVVSLVVGLLMFHNKVLGPLSVSVGITVVIMLTGIVQAPRYPLTRLLNCVLGCLLAAAVGLIPLLLKGRAGSLGQRIGAASAALLDGPEDLAAAKALHAENGRQLGLLRQDIHYERGLSGSELEQMGWRHEANAALLAVHEAARGEGKAADFEQWFRALTQRAMEAHGALLEGAEGVLPHSGRVPVAHRHEAVAALALLEYLRVLGGHEGARQQGPVEEALAVGR